MLLRAYIIRLADGLLASGARLSVVTDTSVASCVLFAGAKVSIYDETFSHLCKTLVRKKSGGVPNVPVSVGLSGTLAAEIWLATKIIVPLHRQSSERAIVGWTMPSLE